MKSPLNSKYFWGTPEIRSCQFPDHITRQLSFLSSSAAPNSSTASLEHKCHFALDHRSHRALPLPAGGLLLGTCMSPGHGGPPWDLCRHVREGELGGQSCAVLCVEVGEFSFSFMCCTVRKAPNQSCLPPNTPGRKSRIKSRDIRSSTWNDHQTCCLSSINRNVTKGPFFIVMDRPPKHFAVCYPEQNHTAVHFYSST